MLTFKVASFDICYNYILGRLFHLKFIAVPYLKSVKLLINNAV
jgi:hypothetical protein